MEYQITYSEGLVRETRYSEDRSSWFSSEEEEAEKFLEEESHQPFIGGTSRVLSLWDEEGNLINRISGCTCHYP